MCGIIGVMVNDLSDDMPLFLKRAAKELFLLAESRGKEAAGVAVLSGETIHVYKEPVSASAMMASQRYKNLIQDALDENQNARGNGNGHPPFALLGHSRLVTNGLQTVNENNQPIITSGMVGVHNGIIVNDTAANRRRQRSQTDERRGRTDGSGELLAGTVICLLSLIW